MSLVRWLLILSCLALVILAALTFAPDSTLAANQPPKRVIPVRINDPCWGCPKPTPGTPGGLKRSASQSVSVTNQELVKTLTPVGNAAEPCVFVEIKGPGGIRALTCWSPKSAKSR
jgi:hypothetical protein